MSGSCANSPDSVNCGVGSCAFPSSACLVEPLADTDYTGICLYRALPDRKRPQPERSSNPKRAQMFDIRPMGITQAIERALANEDRPVAETPLVRLRARRRRRTGPSRRDLLINEQTVRVPLTRGSGIRAHSPDRRTDRLVLRQPVVEDSRAHRSDDGRRRYAARPADPETPLPGSTLDFWRVESLRARPTAPAVCGDASPGACMA